MSENYRNNGLLPEEAVFDRDTAPRQGSAPVENGGLPFSPTDDEAEAQYSSVLQGKPLHGLIASSTAHGNIQLNAVTHEGTIQSEGVLITIDEEAIQDISAQTFKVLIILLRVLTAQLPHESAVTAEAVNKGRTVQITLGDYMKACRIKDKKEARAQLNNAIRALYAVSLEWDEQVYDRPEGKSRKVKVTKHHRLRVTDHTITEESGKPVKNGVALFKFSFDMAEYLSNAYIMPYPDALLTINTHNHPYSIPLGWRLCALHNMNYGKSTQNTTTVKTLLSAAKGIPRYSDLAQRGNIYDRLVYPFDRDLAALVEAGVLSTYWYYDDSGARIDGGSYKGGKYTESGKLALLSYTEFSALYIHYELKNYPDQTPRLEAKSKRISAAISRRKNAAKKKADKAGDGAKT